MLSELRVGCHITNKHNVALILSEGGQLRKKSCPESLNQNIFEAQTLVAHQATFLYNSMDFVENQI